MRLRWLGLACAVGWSWPGRAQACSVILPQKQTISCTEGNTGGAGGAGGAPSSVADAQLLVQAVEIQRSSYPPPGRGDCGELGSTRLRFQLAGSSAWPADVGVLLTLREGQSGYFAPPLSTIAGTSGWLLLPQAGAVRLFGPDDPRAPLSLRLDARAVDCKGGLSAPVEVKIAHPGRSDLGGGDVGSSEDGGDQEDGKPGRRDAGAAAPDAAAVTAAPEAGATEKQAQAGRTPPAGSSCAVCSLHGAARRAEGAPGLGLALGALALALRRRRR